MSTLDPTKPIGPENFQWVSRKELWQRRDKVTWLTVDGETLTVSDWARRKGHSSARMILRRLDAGWDAERAINQQPSGFQFLDLTGQRFGRLTVQARLRNNRHSQVRWECLCDCGNVAQVGSNSLRKGSTRSCGCLRKSRERTPVEKSPSGYFKCIRCSNVIPLTEKLPGYRCLSCGPAKPQQGPRYKLWVRTKDRALKAGIPFNIDIDDIVIPAECPALGIPLKLMSDLDYTPTLDRMIPELGYTKGNVNVISWRANSLKKNGTLAELEGIVQWMRSVQGK